MKVFAYHNSYNGVSSYRVWQPMKYLKALGEEVRGLPKRLDKAVIPMDGKGNVPGAESHTAITKWADLIFSNFRTSYFDTGRMFAQSKVKPLVVDIDDDLVNIPQWLPSYKEWQGGPDHIEECTSMPAEAIAARKAEGWGEVTYEGRKCLFLPNPHRREFVKDQCKAAKMLTVSTERLKEVYAGWCDRIEVVPNSVDFDVWPENKRHDDGLVRIGLFGSNTHNKDWQEVWDAIQRILAEFPNVRLCMNSFLILDEFMDGKRMHEVQRHHQLPEGLVKRGLHENLQVEIYEPVEIEDYPKWLADKGIDIGLAPLNVHETFNRAKSNIKYLEFGTLRVPGIYGDLDPYADVQDGVTGLKCSKPDDYYKALKKLVLDADLRKKIGDAARADVEKRYNQADTSRKLQALFASVLKEWNDEKAAVLVGASR